MDKQERDKQLAFVEKSIKGFEFRQAIIKRAEEIFKAVEEATKDYVDDFKQRNGDTEKINILAIDNQLWKSNNGSLWDSSSKIDNLIAGKGWQVGYWEKTFGLDKYIRENLERFIEAWREDDANQKLKKRIDAIELKQPTQKPSSRRVLNQHM